MIKDEKLPKKKFKRVSLVILRPRVIHEVLFFVDKLRYFIDETR